MKKIQSFEVDHDVLEKGMYVSRVDDNIVTYDIRMVKPNTPPYLDNAGAHAFEHLFATFARNGEYFQNVVYVGPMGCRTGFYFITRDLEHEKAIEIVKDSMKFISEFEGEIPGTTRKECGNYLDHDLETAKRYAKDFLEVIKNWKVEDLSYEKSNLK
jgi:S-ribosylhomocysteine lyase